MRRDVARVNCTTKRRKRRCAPYYNLKLANRAGFAHNSTCKRLPTIEVWYEKRILMASLATFFTLSLGQAAFAAAQGAGSENVEKMRVFTELDADGDGSLTQAELAQGGKLRFAKADKNKDGFLSHAELRNQMVEKMQQRSSRKMTKMMALRDTDKDGKLSFEELRPALGGSTAKMFARMDENDDGTLLAEESAKIQR